MKKPVLLFTMLFSTTLLAQPWVENKKLYVYDQQTDDNLGISASIDGNYAISGAWHHDLDTVGGTYLNNAGAAYIFKYDASSESWGEEAKLIAADRAVLDAFGISVDISGTYAVVGAVEKDAARGAAYVFEKVGGTWIQVVKLEAPVRHANDRFGNSVAISGDTIVVGAYHEDEDENDLNTLQNAGSAYIFARTSGSWGLYQKIVASDRDPQDYFGYDVAIEGGKILVGAYRYDPDTLGETGGAYVFEYGSASWGQTKILRAFTPYQNDRFGWSVAIHHNWFVIGAPYHGYDINGMNAKLNSGAAYIYDRDNSWAEFKVAHTYRIDQDNLGEDVAVYGNTVVAGAPNQDYDTANAQPYWANAGAAYVFGLDPGGSGTWSQNQKLITGDRFTQDRFGYSVGVSSTFILGGAPEDNLDSSAAKPSVGALYFFKQGSNIGVNEDDLAKIKIYPNPVREQLLIDLGNNFEGGQIQIISSLGHILKSKEINAENDHVFNLEGFSSGMYILNVANFKGFSKSFKFIKL